MHKTAKRIKIKDRYIMNSPQDYSNTPIYNSILQTIKSHIETMENTHKLFYLKGLIQTMTKYQANSLTDYIRKNSAINVCNDLLKSLSND